MQIELALNDALRIRLLQDAKLIQREARILREVLDDAGVIPRPIVLPPRQRHDDYVRQHVPNEILVPQIY